jgi:hypothetical protein
MPGPHLLDLFDKLDTRRREEDLYLFGLMAHHHGDVLDGRDLGRGVSDLLDQRKPTGPVQDLGAL